MREQLRRGADFVKVMSTGARSVELEDPDPAQLTAAELATLVEEAHRMGYRVAAHAEGLAGTELAIEHGVDTIEHGMYLHRRPDLLERMARAGQFLVPTLSCFYGVAGTADPAAPGRPAETWSPLLVELAEYNLEEADRTLTAARDAGVRIAMGFDWTPLGGNAIEIVRMVRHGLGTRRGAGRGDRDRRRRPRPRRARRHRRAGQARRPARRRRRPARGLRAAAAPRADLARRSSSASRSPAPRSSACRET